MVLAMQLSAAFVLLYLPLRFLAHYRPILRQKSIVLLQLYVLSWGLLIANTVLVAGPKVGGLYFITFMNAGFLLSLVIGLSEHFELPPAIKSRIVKRVHQDEDGEHEETANQATETTPLLETQGEDDIRDLPLDEENQFVLWGFEFLLAVPFTMILLTQINLMALYSLQHTLADGNSPLPGNIRLVMRLI